MEDQARPGLLVVGRISGLYGVRGWVKVFSETEPRDNILTYQPWYLGAGHKPRGLAAGKPQGKGLVARLEGCEDRDQAAALVGSEIRIHRDQLPRLGADEFYWADLVGLSVETLDARPLGRVERVFATAANDVLVVNGDRERWLPFLWDRVIKEVDLDLGRIRVDWDPEF
ncbi:ribosome maturation factor RimM [Candidatus Thiosymbion oneisti]|uniref:ribosome maturation factor RimM n=1 Tax=Candidatus Thiosymbion oneisti TaxID=589554 RepID=UPI000ABEC6FB|nr:ribosome maturation factor RimM [Candidatus Thiosymbion oneisti]